MAITHPIHSATAAAPSTETDVVRSIHTTLKCLFGLVPIVAGADKFTNILTDWHAYLNPLALRVVPVSADAFLHAVGVIEIIAGILVFLKPRLGGFVVMAWLLAIAGQLLVWGRFLDVAVRDIVIALGGALVLARLTPYAVTATPPQDQSRS